MQRRLSPAERVEVARAYQAGTDMKALAVQYGVHSMSISRCLHSLGIPLRRQGLCEQDLAEAARLYAAGWSLTQIGGKYGCSHTTVRRALIGHGVAMRQRRGWRY